MPRGCPQGTRSPVSILKSASSATSSARNISTHLVQLDLPSECAGFSLRPSRHPTAHCHTASSRLQRSVSGAWGRQRSGAIQGAPPMGSPGAGTPLSWSPWATPITYQHFDLGYIQFAAMKKQTPFFTRKGDWFLVSILRLQFLGSNIDLTGEESQDRSQCPPRMGTKSLQSLNMQSNLPFKLSSAKSKVHLRKFYTNSNVT